MDHHRSKKSKGNVEDPAETLAMKMMLKMGYKPGAGLGKDGTGIVDPIEVKLRSRNTGLGFDDESGEEVTLVRPTIKAFDYEERPRVRRSWRRQPVDNEKELEASTSNANSLPYTLKTSNNVKIIDYRSGGTGRELSSLEGYRSVETVKGGLFPELRHNLSLLIGMAEGEVEKMGRERQIKARRNIELREEKEILLREIGKLNLLKEENVICKKILLESFMLTSDWEAYLKWLYNTSKVMDTVLQDEKHKKYIGGAVVGTVIRFIKNTFNLDDSEEGTLLDQDLLTILNDFYRVPFNGLAGKHFTPYEQVFNDLFLPRLRSSLISSLSSKKKDSTSNSIYGANLLTSWMPLFPNRTLIELLNLSIIPILTKLVEDWNPLSGDDLHSWILPWMAPLQPYLRLNRNQFIYESFVTLLRKKLVFMGKSQEDPTSIEYLNLLSFWRPPVLDQCDFDVILSKTVVPCLLAKLKSELKTEPGKEAVKPIEVLCQWRHLLGLPVAADMLSQILFPSLRSRLYHLVTTKSTHDIPTWYMFWKNLLPPDLIHLKTIQDGFNDLLNMMNQLTEDPTIPPRHFNL